VVGGPAATGQAEGVRRPLVVEPERGGERLHDRVGGVLLAPLLQAQVVLGADPRQERDLLAAQPGHPAAGPRREPDVLRPDQRTPGAQEVAEGGA